MPTHKSSDYKLSAVKYYLSHSKNQKFHGVMKVIIGTIHLHEMIKIISHHVYCEIIIDLTILIRVYHHTQQTQSNNNIINHIGLFHIHNYKNKLYELTNL